MNHTDARGERIESDEAAALKSLLSEASTVAAGSDARPPAPLIEADLARARASSARRRRARRGAGACTVLTAAAATIAVVALAQPAHHPNHPQPISNATNGAAPVMRLASYSLRLPRDYRLTAEATSDCPPLDVAFMRPEPTAPMHPADRATATASRADVPQYASLDATQAHPRGGCIGMVLAPPYTPTAASTDPESAGLAGARAVLVGRYAGRAGSSTLFAQPSDVRSTLEWLYVEIPLADGQHQDLVVSSTGLSQSSLIALIANGLTVG
ncbi:MAG TPA: hypothetical protein VIL16_28350 [Trebonia sp.]